MMFARFACLLSLVVGLSVGVVAAPGAVSSSPGTFALITAPQSVHSDSATLYWDKPASTDATTTYRIFRDGELLGETTKNHFTLKLLTPSTTYVFTVKATRASGELAASNSLRLQTAPVEKILSVEAFGAKGDGVTNNTRALQAAIDACPVNGIVRIPRGTFLSGALFLKSDMTLEIAAGGVLKGSASPDDYAPFIRNRFEGWELDTYASLLNAGRLDHAGPANVRHLRICGEGKISGGGDALGKAMIAAHGLRSRGRLLCLMNCANVEIQGVTLEESPCWTLHYLYCENVSCHDLTIKSHVRNGDGIDPDSSRNSYIFNCTFDTGDDCIAIKSGKNPEGNLIARATEGVRITDCRFDRGHGISIGSEMSGGVRDVLVQDCTAGPLLYGLQIKATPERGGFVEDVTVRDCDLRMITIFTKLNYNNDGQAAPAAPFFKNFCFENIDLSKADPAKPIIIVQGFAATGHRTSDVNFKAIKLPRGAKVQVDQAEAIVFTDVTTPDAQKPVYEITRSERITY